MGMLLKSLLDTGLVTENGPKAGLNVYAELGSAWSNVMRDTVAAQHFLGKLLKYRRRGQHLLGHGLDPRRQPAEPDRDVP